MKKKPSPLTKDGKKTMSNLLIKRKTTDTS